MAIEYKDSGKVHYLKVEVLTPVHIGSGRDLLKGFDFVPIGRAKKTHLMIPNKRKLFEVLGSDPKALDNMMQVSVKHSEGNHSFLTDFVQRYANRNALADRFLAFSIPEPNTVKEAIHTADGQPLFPGSALKGAIRTAMIAQRLLHPTPAMHIPRLKQGKMSDQDYAFAALGGRNGDFSDNIMRMMQVGDAVFQKGISACAEVKVSNFLGAGVGKERWENKGGRNQQCMNHAVEMIPKDQIAALRINMGHLIQPLNRVVAHEKTRRVTWNNSIRDRNDHFHLPKAPPNPGELAALFQTIRVQSKRRIEAEIKFWEKQGRYPGAPKSLAIGWGNLLEKQDNLSVNECLIQVGAGGGFWGMTGDWQEAVLSKFEYDAFQDRVNKRQDYPFFPKTRRSIEGLPPGWIKLSVISREEYLAIMRENEKPAEMPDDKPDVEYFTGTPKYGTELFAEVLGPDPARNNWHRLKLFVGAPGNEPIGSVRYPSGLEMGTFIKVRLVNPHNWETQYIEPA